MRHARLVAHVGSQVRRLARVVFGERLHLPAVPFAALPRQEAKGAVARGRELPMRLCSEIENTFGEVRRRD